MNTRSTTNTFAPIPVRYEIRKSFPLPPPKSSIVVVGAGAFGGWSALFLLRAGFRVTLVDDWGPGNARSSSGDETRVIRSTYGNNEFYFDLNVRALTLWKENQERFGQTLFVNSGVLWFCYHPSTPLVDDSIPFAIKHNMPYTVLNPAEVERQYPAINVSDLHHAYHDPFGGYLKAREACVAVRDAFSREGGEYIQASALPGEMISGSLKTARLSNGKELQANTFLFACGSWMGQLFPDILGNVITCTRQEVYYFGLPSGHSSEYESLPVWVDVDGRDYYYGIPGNSHRGFKIGVDVRGPAFNPSTDDRITNQDVLSDARRLIAHRFPGLNNAPLIEGRVCPYENSPDGNFIFDNHPNASNLWLLGGGSGHGFKHGPALGELVAEVLAGKRGLPPLLIPRAGHDRTLKASGEN